MLSKKLFLWGHKIALFAIMFASLAPSISHALAAQQGINAFTQEVCSTSGKKITIQAVTTKGQQLSTELSTKDADSREPAGIQHHLQHCPFCANPSTDTAIQVPHAPIVAALAQDAQHIAAAFQIDSPRFSVLPPPAQAPPSI